MYNVIIIIIMCNDINVMIMYINIIIINIRK